MNADDDPALSETLKIAVPLWIFEFRHCTDAERRAIEQYASVVISAQGDTLQYGSARSFGHSEQQWEKHLDAGGSRTVTPGPGGSSQGRCRNDRCWCRNASGPRLSAGEVFNEIARGLAAAAYRPGGVSFAGLHWCLDHAVCTATAGEPSAP